MDLIRKFPFENILLDAALLAAAFLLPDINPYVAGNLTLAFWLAAPVQVIALFCAFWNRDEFAKGRPLPNWLSAAHILACVLAVGGFVWLYLVAFAVEKQAGVFPYWGFRFAFVIALFGGIIAYMTGRRMSDETDLPVWGRYLLVVPVFIYLCFTESLLEVSLAISTPGTLTVIVAACISYLPVRLTLAFQPPFSYWDLTSAFVCFGFYLYWLVCVSGP